MKTVRKCSGFSQSGVIISPSPDNIPFTLFNVSLLYVAHA